MERLANYFVQCLRYNQIIQEDQEEVYLYGFRLLLNSMMTSLWIFLWGCLLVNPFLSIVAIVCLSCLRQYGGGYHANSYLKCFLITSLNYWMLYQAVVWKIGHRWPLMMMGLSLVSTVYLVKIGSTNHPRNPKTKEELEERAKKTRFYTILYSIVSCLLLALGTKYVDFATVIIGTQVCTALSIMAIKIKKGDVVE